MKEPVNLGEDYYPFFITGSGRCGTTLLWAILSQSPELCIFNESQVLARLIHFWPIIDISWDRVPHWILNEFGKVKHFKNYRFVPDKRYYDYVLALPESKRSLAKIINQFYESYQRRKKPDTKRWGDKTPLYALHVDEIDALFPRAQWINLVRDGRDVVASLLRYGRYRKIEDACERWNMAVDKMHGFELANEKKVLTIFYERLVGEPESEVRDVCRFLGARFDKKMLSFPQIPAVIDLKRPQNWNIANSINTKAIGRWRKDFTGEQMEQVEKLTGDNLEIFGYE